MSQFKLEDADILIDLANQTLTELMATKPNFATIKSTLKKAIEVYVERKTERKPLVIPVVMDENR